MITTNFGKFAAFLVLPCTAILFASFATTSAQQARQQESGLEQGIAWYGVLKDGLEQAKESNKPILLVSAAPQCNSVSGMW